MDIEDSSRYAGAFRVAHPDNRLPAAMDDKVKNCLLLMCMLICGYPINNAINNTLIL